ncbi:hypothetical protein NQ315_011019 [Exocentrus adspersus]|uniref:Uncharacterized protein n=1 Tax=Exocentrus adspersus TaxID=1586481 RepID=A0AAV8VJX1_9CUCU|nr:hypothetical protein NQ315_011019 [Exocentrus adspersus]
MRRSILFLQKEATTEDKKRSFPEQRASLRHARIPKDSRTKEIRDKFNKHTHNDIIIKEAKDYVQKILSLFDVIRDILDSRLRELSVKNTEVEDEYFSDSSNELEDIDSNSCRKIKMGEKFCLKTAASLLPLMDGTEEVTKRLMESIEFYDSLLDADNKKLLIQYVLKTRLSQNAKIRLKSSYQTSAQLILDLKKHFIVHKSAVALSAQLNSARQESKTIDEFGKTVEELLTELTIAQADGDSQVLDILKVTNEKIAINIFANGLRSNELRTIVKARNYPTLSEAIRGAVDEKPSSSTSQERVFHFNRVDTGATISVIFKKHVDNAEIINSSDNITIKGITGSTKALGSANLTLQICNWDIDRKKECVVLPDEIGDGIFVAGGLVKPENGEVPIRILNTRAEQVTLTNFSPKLDKLDNYQLCSFKEDNVMTVI